MMAMMVETISIGNLTMEATVNGKAIQMAMILDGGVRNLRTMSTGTNGGITVSTMTQTGTALTTSDRARNSSTLRTETSGQVQTMMAMAPQLQKRLWNL